MLALPVATADTGTIIAAVQCALAAIWRPGFRYKKARVMLLDPVKADRVQAHCLTGLMTPGGRPACASRQAQQALRPRYLLLWRCRREPPRLGHAAQQPLAALQTNWNATAAALAPLLSIVIFLGVP